MSANPLAGCAYIRLASFKDPAYVPPRPPCCSHSERDPVSTSLGIKINIKNYLEGTWKERQRKHDQLINSGFLMGSVRKVARFLTEQNAQKSAVSATVNVVRESLLGSDQLVQLCLRDVIDSRCLYLQVFDMEKASECCNAILLELRNATLTNVRELDISENYEVRCDLTNEQKKVVLSLIEKPRALIRLNVENFYEGMPAITTFTSFMTTDIEVEAWSPRGAEPSVTMEHMGGINVAKAPPEGHCGNPDTKGLADALSHQTQLQSLRMGYNGISSAMSIDSLALLNLNSLTEISFAGNPLSTEAMIVLSEVLKKHPSITLLDLANCPSITVEGFQALASVIESNSPLEQIILTLGRCNLPGYDSELLSHEGVKVPFSAVVYGGLPPVAAALDSNTHLQVLDLTGRLMSPEESLAFNRSIRTDRSNIVSIGKMSGVGCSQPTDDELLKEIDVMYPVKLTEFLRQRQAQRAPAAAATSSSSV